jgi:hypothetical protein
MATRKKTTAKKPTNQWDYYLAGGQVLAMKGSKAVPLQFRGFDGAGRSKKAVFSSTSCDASIALPLENLQP